MRARRSHLGRSRLLGIAAAALFLLPAGVTAKPAGECVVTVRGSHTTFDTVQAALDASPAGVTVLVEGTCHGATLVSRDATIRAHSKGATLHGQGLSERVLTVSTGATLELQGLIVTGGSTDGGILNEGTLHMVRSTVTGNSAFAGGGIANSGDATIRHSLIDQNGFNVGPNIYNTGTLRVTHSILSRGSGRHGLGLLNAGTATLEHTQVIDNLGFIPLRGGGIWNTGDLTLRHSEVRGNTALLGAGILNEGTTHVIRSRVVNNTSEGGLGGGIFNGEPFLNLPVPGELFVTDSVIAGNSAGRGGGIFNLHTVTLEGHTRIGGNTATDQGGGIFNESGASVTGVSRKTFRPPNTPDDCSGC